MLMTAPLNFTKTDHWRDLYPASKLVDHLTSMGFEIMAAEDNLMVIEPLDLHGNVIVWKCWAVACRKE